MFGTAGCLSALPGLGPDDAAETGGEPGTAPLELAGWETTTHGAAAADVVGETELSLRVYRCSMAEIKTGLGTVEGQLGLSFDYTVTAEGWYEIPTVAIVEDGTEQPLQRVDIERQEYSTTQGAVETTVPVDGEVGLAFRLEPSGHCNNSDHADTFFEVRNIDVERA
jgi:hypothetical protein